MSTSPTYDQRLAKAFERFDAQFAWYDKHSDAEQIKFKIGQVLTLVLTAATPVLVAAGGVPDVWQAGTGAAATVSAAAMASFNWRGNWIRFAATAEALKSERAHFETRTSAAYGLTLSDDEVLEAFVTRTEAITAHETGAWGTELSQVATPADPAGNGSGAQG